MSIRPRRLRVPSALEVCPRLTGRLAGLVDREGAEGPQTEPPLPSRHAVPHEKRGPARGLHPTPKPLGGGVPVVDPGPFFGGGAEGGAEHPIVEALAGHGAKLARGTPGHTPEQNCRKSRHTPKSPKSCAGGDIWPIRGFFGPPERLRHSASQAGCRGFDPRLPLQAPSEGLFIFVESGVPGLSAGEKPLGRDIARSNMDVLALSSGLGTQPFWTAAVGTYRPEARRTSASTCGRTPGPPPYERSSRPSWSSTTPRWAHRPASALSW